MAADVTIVSRLRMGTKRGALVDITFSDPYPTGGEEVTLPLAAVEEILFSQKPGYLFEYDRDDGKIKVYTPDGSEVANNKELSDLTVRAFIIGF